MPRLLFEKTGNAVWISHLDLMRLFQRAFKRAGLPLTHSKGFNPRPSVSIALPLSVGIESHCELLDFELENVKVSNEDILTRLNEALIAGIRVLDVYDEMNKIKNLSLLRCYVWLEYDGGIPQNAQTAIQELFCKPELVVQKKGKNGVVDQNIIPMIRNIAVVCENEREIKLDALICCQNPTLNPVQLSAAIEKYLPEMKPDFVRCARVEVYDHQEKLFR